MSGADKVAAAGTDDALLNEAVACCAVCKRVCDEAIVDVGVGVPLES